MKLKLYQEVALVRDVLDENLRSGDVAVRIRLCTPSARRRSRAVLEVFNAAGESVSVVTVPESTIAPLRAAQVPAVRMLLQPA